MPVVAVLVVATVLGACADGSGDPLAAPPGSTAAGVLTTGVGSSADLPPATYPPGAVTALRPEVLETRPHDPGAFTQGLELVDGRLYESTGLRGSSTLREVDPVTGAVLRQVALEPHLFGEGLTAVGDDLVQLTWQEGVALVWDRATFSLVDQVPVPGEGWGLCHDEPGGRLVQSDGSPTLTFRSPEGLAPLGQVLVTEAGVPVEDLNELECDPATGLVWANVWRTTDIVGIDLATGEVRARVDASGLVPAGVGSDAVLNGVAALGDGTYLVTGKWWPVAHVVRFVP